MKPHRYFIGRSLSTTGSSKWKVYHNGVPYLTVYNVGSRTRMATSSIGSFRLSHPTSSNTRFLGYRGLSSTSTRVTPTSTLILPWSFPHPVSYSDGDFAKTVNDPELFCTLPHTHRQLVISLLRHTSCPVVVKEIVNLDEDSSILLARLIMSALCKVRGWGGRHEDLLSAISADLSSFRRCDLEKISLENGDKEGDSTSVTGAKEDPQQASPKTHKRRLRTQYQGKMTIVDYEATLMQISERLGWAQVLNSVRGLANLRRNDRTSKMRQGCLKRQGDKCAVGGSDFQYSRNAHGSHILPYNVLRAPTVAESAFWILVALLLGEQAMLELLRLVTNEGVNETINGIALRHDIHHAFDGGCFYLMPIMPVESSLSPNMSTLTEYTVRFRWKVPAKSSRTLYTLMRKDPNEQIAIGGLDGRLYVLEAEARNIDQHDVFTLFTNDALKYPLPHPALLSARTRLWSMVADTWLFSISAGLEKAVLNNILETSRNLVVEELRGHVVKSSTQQNGLFREQTRGLATIPSMSDITRYYRLAHDQEPIHEYDFREFHKIYPPLCEADYWDLESILADNVLKRNYPGIERLFGGTAD